MLEGIPENVEVIDAGLFNRNSGPEFFNAKLRIGGTLWVGNVVTLEKCSDWYLKGFDKNEKYNNVVLAVILEDDGDITNSQGDMVNYIVPRIPEKVKVNYRKLIDNDCSECLRYNAENGSFLMYHSWMAALQTEWMEEASEKCRKLYDELGSWQVTHFVMLARQFGFGVNDDMFEKWAKRLSFDVIGQYRDDLFQLEALLLGQAGLLNLEAVPSEYQKKALNEGYLAKLRNEFLYLSHKHNLKPLDYRQWISATNAHYSPQRCISWLAYYIYMRMENHANGEIFDYDRLKKAYDVKVSTYWKTHSQFGKEYDYGEKLRQMLPNDLVVYVDVPFYFAFGRKTQKEDCCDHAFDLMEQGNVLVGSTVRKFRSFGFRLDNAGDSLGAIQLKNEYCCKKRCLRCRFGYEYIKNK